MKLAWAISLFGFLATVSLACAGLSVKEDGYHVFPGDRIQEALDAAARNPSNKVVKVHAGEYRPDSKRQALIWLNRIHDGIRLEAVGRVILTAANAELSDPKSHSHPAVVNHVVYLGDGLSAKTVIKGFRITGANNFVTTAATAQMEPDTTLPKGHFFYSDGGGIKIYGRSYPTITDCELVDNYASPCAGGISVEHYGQRDDNHRGEVAIQQCTFRNNRARVMGAAVDLLPGISARIVNCLFVGNCANLGTDYLSPEFGFPPGTNSAVLTVFNPSRVTVKNSTFVHNRNGADDRNTNSIYLNCIFWDNTLEAGLPGGKRYELDIQGRAQVTGCFFGGRVLDPNRVVSVKDNVLNAPAPDFDELFVPQSPAYKNAGYRPARAEDW
jgi:hypothetical protein